ncbi:MAG: sigma 54-interacting transcriptional regulator [Planctomycetota bacterium]|nr:sigma 54-interacting transcriptional regulator [Planctomycetota bacterium]
MTTQLRNKVTGTPIRARVLVVTGPQGAPELSGAMLRLGHEVQEADTLEGALAALALGVHDVMFIDAVRIQGLQPMPALPTIVIDNNPESPVSPNCVGILPSTASASTIASLIGLVMDLQITQARCENLAALVTGIRDGSAFAGNSPVMRRLQGAIRRAADNVSSTVLIEGEHGSGKSLAARAIHCKGRRGTMPIVQCPASTLDPETFVRVLNEARGTTLLIEEISQLPLATQQALVRNLKERAGMMPTDTPPARIIATTSTHLADLVARGTFREDLLYRLHAFHVVMPSLREHLEDMPSLVASVVAQCATGGSSTMSRGHTITPAAMTMLGGMSWPGNVAQFESVVSRAFFQAGGALIDREHVQQAMESMSKSAVTTPATHVGATSPGVTGEVTEASIRLFKDEERRILGSALKATSGRSNQVRRAAQLLGIGRATLYRKIQQYNLPLH